MEVLDPRHTVITNAEVLRLLQSRRKEQNELPKDQRSKILGTVIYETSKYLQGTPVVAQRNVDIEKFIRAATPFKLTAIEILQLINLRPVTAIEIQLIVEECEERLNEEQVESLLAVSFIFLLLSNT
uniref:DNA-directed RNA polymerase III subunit RPC9 n=1 Tax=Elaeophora elaphi TaxID=1147741 RepID=A0A0R3S6X1_9BILA